MIKQKVDIEPPDEWSSENADAICMLRKWLNTFQTTTINLSREELQTVVDAAAEKFGIVPTPQYFVVLDADGDWWVWDEQRDAWRFKDQLAGFFGFEKGLEGIRKTYGISRAKKWRKK